MDSNVVILRKNEMSGNVLKAISFNARNGSLPQVITPGEESIFTMGADATWLRPPYDPRMLCQVYENSNALRQNVDAYVVNIDSFGHRLKPALDLKGNDDDDTIFEILLRRRKPEDPDPTPEETDNTKRQLRRAALREKRKLDLFFQCCCPDLKGGFTELRKRTRADLEVTANAYWEILRDGQGRVTRLEHVPSVSMRLVKSDPNHTVITQRVVTGPFQTQRVNTPRRFRRFVQLTDHEAVSSWFKQFGDPRFVSSKTGNYYKSRAALAKAEPGIKPATEILHWEVFSARTPYGIPRWIGNIYSALGSREMEIVNFGFFQSKSVPPLAILVSGGAQLNDPTVKRLERFIAENLHGKENFWNILVLQAKLDETAPGLGKAPKIEIKPLTSAIMTDATHMEYDRFNRDKVGESFRNPRIVRGDSKDFNKACYDIETETLTETGWKKLGAFEPGEKIAAYNPETDAIDFVVPDRLYTYDVHNESLYHFKTRVADIMVTRDHNMLVSSLKGSFENRKVQSIPWSRYKLKTTTSGRCTGEHLDFFSVPKCDKCKIERGHKHEPVKTEDFLEFLGYWISEGSLLQTKHPNAPYIVTCSQKRGPIADKMRACFDRLEWSYSESYSPADAAYRWTWSNRCLRQWLLTNCGGYSYEKTLPTFAKNLSHGLSTILLQSLMDGDGSMDKREGRHSGYYSSTSRTLVDDVQALAIRLGYRASTCTHYEASKTRRACYRTLISRGCDAQFRLPPEKVNYTGTVYCFSVPGYGYFVTRRNGKVAIQGNTAQAALRFAQDQVYDPERDSFDQTMNGFVMPALGASFWQFETKTRRSRDPERLAVMVKDLVDAGVMTPREARREAEDIFNRKFARIDAEWVDQPVMLTQAALQNRGDTTVVEVATPEEIEKHMEHVADGLQDIVQSHTRL